MWRDIDNYDSDNKKKDDDVLKEMLIHGRVFVVAAGIIAVIQALTWISITTTGIIKSDCVAANQTINAEWIPDKDFAINNFGEVINILYFTDWEYCLSAERSNQLKIEDKRNIKSKDTYIWFAVILSFSILWLISSVLMIGSVRNEVSKMASFFILGWCFLTIIICIIDLGLGILLGIDLGKDAPFMIKITETAAGEETINPIIFPVSTLYQFATGFMMTMAFKGFIFWIFNAASAITLITLSTKIIEPEEDNSDPHNNPMARRPINAYESQPEIRQAPWSLESQTMERPRFQNQQSNVGLNRYNSYQGSVNQGYSGMEDSKYQQQQPLASIMKRSVADAQRQNDQRRTREPNVPNPDYSPPAVRPKPPYKSQYSDNSYYSNKR